MSYSLKQEENMDSPGTEKCCLFCYKPVRHTVKHDADRDVSQEEETEDTDKKKTFCQFYNLICSTFGSHNSHNKDVHGTCCNYPGVCDDCFYAVNMYCKLYQDMEDLQKKLFWNLNQLHNIMKSASKLSSRVKHFHESFQHQHLNTEGDLVVTIRKGQMDKAVECRQLLFNACARNLNVNCVNEQLEKVPENCAKPTDEIGVAKENRNDNSNGNPYFVYIVKGDIAKEMETLKIPAMEIAAPAILNRIVSAASTNSQSKLSANNNHTVVELSPNTATPVKQTPFRKNVDVKPRLLMRSFVRLQDIKEDQKSNKAMTEVDVKEEGDETTSSLDSLSTTDEPGSDGDNDPDSNVSTEADDSSVSLMHDHYPCKFCDFSTNQAGELVDHEITHHRGTSTISKKIKCPRCPKSLGIRKSFHNLHYFRWHLGISELKKHVSERHLACKQYKCTICKVEIASKAALKQHIIKIHPKRQDLINALSQDKMVSPNKGRSRTRGRPRVYFNDIDELIS